MRCSFDSLSLLALALPLVLASCRDPASTSLTGPDPAQGSATPAVASGTPPATGDTAAPPAAGDEPRSESHTIEMDDDSTVFGFAAYGGRWVIGTAFTDDRNDVSLRPVEPKGIGPALHVLSQGGFPLALVGETDSSRAPWVVSKAHGKPWHFVARSFDGGRETKALEIPDEERGLTRTAFRFDGGVTGVIAYHFELTRPLTKAERRAILAEHKRHEKRGEHDVPPAGESVSPHKTLATGMRYFGPGAKQPFEAVRVPAGDPIHLGWLAVATGANGWLGAHWERRSVSDTVAESHVAVHWFDARSAHVRSTSVLSPHGTSSGQVVLAGDGTAYVVADRSSPFDKGAALELLAFDSAGTPLPSRTLPVPGWIADTTTSIDCGGHTWLLFDAYASNGEEVIVLLELEPRGKLVGEVLWSRKDPRPSGNGSRPGRVLHAACDGKEAAVAMQLWDLDAGHELALASWDASAGSQ